MQEHKYKSKVLKRTCKRCMIAVIITAIPGIIAGLFNRWLFIQPYTEAHIIFKTKDNMEHECRFTIGHYGDYEEGIEPELEKMLQSDKELFMKKKVPVFYCPKDVNRCIVYLEDSQ